MTNKPADRKKSKEELARYSFEYKGETYEMTEGASFADLAKPGFQRKNRNRAPDDLFYTMIETVFDADTLEATFDDMDEDEAIAFTEDFMKAWQEFAGATPGES